MYLILLRFSKNKAQASHYMAGHQDWVKSGIDDGVFLLIGNIRPGLGGVILAKGMTIEEANERVTKDPFVAHDVVSAEIIDIDVNTADPRLAFLIEP